MPARSRCVSERIASRFATRRCHLLAAGILVLFLTPNVGNCQVPTESNSDKYGLPFTASDEDSVSGWQLMLDDALTMAKEKEFRVARELVTAARSRAVGQKTRAAADRIAAEIDRMEFGVERKMPFKEQRSGIVRIPEIAPDENRVMQVVSEDGIATVEPTSSLVRATDSSSVTSNQVAGDGAELPKQPSSEPKTSGLPVPNARIGYTPLDRLVKNFGIQQPDRQIALVEPELDHSNRFGETIDRRSVMPTIVINPMTPMTHADAGLSIQPNQTSRYSPRQLTYFSAFCFVIGLLMCPATLIVGLAISRRVAGRNGALVQISVMRDETLQAETVSSPDRKEEVSNATESDSPDGSGECDARILRLKTVDRDASSSRLSQTELEEPEELSPEILSIEESDPTVDPSPVLLPADAKPNIFRQIVDHNLSLQVDAQSIA